MLGTFSKSVVPGLRIGWVVTPEKIIDTLRIAKQASDLHTNIFAQKLLNEYLKKYSMEGHLKK